MILFNSFKTIKTDGVKVVLRKNHIIYSNLDKHCNKCAYVDLNFFVIKCVFNKGR